MRVPVTNVFRDIALLTRVSTEFIRGFHVLRKTGAAVTVFGSARLPDDHPGCKVVYDICHHLAKNDVTVITGGGGSVMGAANKGAHDAGGTSVGINITLPFEGQANPFVNLMFHCRYFFVRKVLLVRYSDAFIFGPGGFGTLDEMLEVLTLIQTGKMAEKPVVIVGRKYWQGFLDWCQNTLLPEGAINQSDIGRLQIVDTAEEVIQILNKNKVIKT